MTAPAGGRLRLATAGDGVQLLSLWELLFDDDADQQAAWRSHADEWLVRFVDDGATARLPLVEVDGEVVASAIGTLELGVPNPHCPRGRTVRLANVFTVPEHRGHGYATLLVHDVITWAREIDADRVDLSSTPDAQHIYETAGFTLTSAPRMKLVLDAGR